MTDRTPSPTAPQRRSRRGFTLIELTVVIVVIAVLAATVFIAYNAIVGKSKIESLRTSARSFDREVQALIALGRDEEPYLPNEYDTWLPPLVAKADEELSEDVTVGYDPVTDSRTVEFSRYGLAVCLYLNVNAKNPSPLQDGNCADANFGAPPGTTVPPTTDGGTPATTVPDEDPDPLAFQFVYPLVQRDSAGSASNLAFQPRVTDISDDGRYVMVLTADPFAYVPGDALIPVVVDTQTGVTSRPADTEVWEHRFNTDPATFVPEFAGAGGALTADGSEYVFSRTMDFWPSGRRGDVAVGQFGSDEFDISATFTDPTDYVERSSYDADISGDGRYIVYSTLYTPNIMDGSTPRSTVILYDRDTGQSFVISDVDHQWARWDTPPGNDYTNDEAGAPGPLVIANYAKVSDDGRHVMFTNYSNSAGDAQDVYTFDRDTGVTTLVSANPIGVRGDTGFSYGWDMTPDGRYIVFTSDLDDRAPGDSNGFIDAYVWDRTTGETVLASLNSDGDQLNGDVLDVSISANGRYVTFSTAADNLVANDWNGNPDVFVRDLTTGSTVLVSSPEDTPGEPSGGHSFGAKISADGEWIVFANTSDPGDQGTTTLLDGWYPAAAVKTVNPFEDGNAPGDHVEWDPYSWVYSSFGWGSVNGDGDLTTAGSGVLTSQATPARSYAVSADGEWVAFETHEQLVPDDYNTYSDIYVQNLVTGELIWVSHEEGSLTPGWNHSLAPSISADGSRVAFFSMAQLTGDNYGSETIYVWDRDEDKLTVASSAGGGIAWSSLDFGSNSISADGRYVVFSTQASMGMPDTNYDLDAFLYDMDTDTTVRVSVDEFGNEMYRGRQAIISGNGQYVLFAGVSDTGGGVWRYSVADGTSELLTPVGDSAQATTENAAISFDGRYVVVPRAFDINEGPYMSTEWGDSGYFASRPFLYDTATGTWTDVTAAPADWFPQNSLWDARYWGVSISADGAYVTFQSQFAPSPNVGGGNLNDDSSRTSMWVYSVATGELRRAGTTCGGSTLAATILSTELTGDGARIAFEAQLADGFFGYPQTVNPYLTNDRGLILLAANPFTGGTAGDCSMTPPNSGGGGGGGGSVNSDDYEYNGGNMVALWPNYPAIASTPPLWAQMSRDQSTIIWSPECWTSEECPDMPDSWGNVYAYDIDSDTNTLISTDPVTGDPMEFVWSPFLMVSDDGRMVLMTSHSYDEEQMQKIWVHDRNSGVTELVSVDADGNPLLEESIAEVMPVISGDGSAIVFGTNIPLLPEDTDDETDLYMRDLASGTLTLVSVDETGAPMAGSPAPYEYTAAALSISPTGRYVMFVDWDSSTDTARTRIFDANTGTSQLLTNVDPDGNTAAWVLPLDMTPDMSYVLVSMLDENWLPQIVRIDMASDDVTLVSVAADGTRHEYWLNPYAKYARISPDGSRVAFGLTVEHAFDPGWPLEEWSTTMYLWDENVGYAFGALWSPAGLPVSYAQWNDDLQWDGNEAVTWTGFASDLDDNEFYSFWRVEF